MQISRSILSAVLISCCLLTTATIIVVSIFAFYLPTSSIPLRIDTKSLRIAIVGAGISGINAGLTLLDSKLFSPENIFIYEGNTNIGGRIHTRVWSPDNQSSEWCGEHFSSNNYVMRNLTDRFNITLLDTIEETNSAYSTTYYFLQRFYNETQAWIDYKSIDSIIREQLAQIGSITYNQSNSYGRYFDNLSLYDWIEQFVPKGHQSSLGEYIDSAYTQEFGVDTQVLNCLMFLQLINPDSQPKDGPLSIYGTFDQRYQMMGGNDQLPRKMGQYLTDQGVTIALAHNLTKITKLGNRYQLAFSNNVTSIFDHVILTIPLTILRHIDYSEAQFDPLKQRIINELNYGTNTKLNLQFSKRFWYDLSADGNIYTDLPFLNSWEESLGQPGNTGILVLFTGTGLRKPYVQNLVLSNQILGGSQGTAFNPTRGFDAILNSSGSISTNAYITKFLNDLNEIWPNSSNYYTGQATVSAPWFDKYFLGSYPVYTLRQYSTIHGYEGERQGNIHFSGDYTSIDYFGTMEGAASEGKRAAIEIINDYK